MILDCNGTVSPLGNNISKLSLVEVSNALALATADIITNSSVVILLSLNLQDAVTSVLVASANVVANDPPA